MKIVKIIILQLAFYHSFCQEVIKPFTLKGRVENQNDGIIRLSYFDYKGNYVVDSSQLINGTFSFSGSITQPTAADIMGNVVSRGVDDINFATIFLHPKYDMEIVLKRDEFKQFKLKGSPTQNEIYKFNKRNSYHQRINDLERIVFHLKMETRKDPTNKVKKDSLLAVRNTLRPLYDSVNNLNLDFIITNKNSYYSIYLFETYVYRLPLDSAKKIFDSFNVEIQQSFIGNRISAQLRGIEGGAPGNRVKDFKGIDVNGDTVKLSEFANKSYVLLDFWATWCKPCREEAPLLIDLHEKYHSKGFEIISIANDDERIDVWKKTIKEDKIDKWKHLLQGVGTLNDIGKLFAVQPLPTKILIDKSGKILLRFEGGQNKDLLNMLSQIFQK